MEDNKAESTPIKKDIYPTFTLKGNPFQRFKEASSAILDEGWHGEDDEEETNQPNQKEND